MNKALNFFKSNLVPNADELLGNLNGMHKRNWAKMNTTTKNLKNGIDNGIFSGDKLKVAKETLESAKQSRSFSKSYLKNEDFIYDNAKSIDIKTMYDRQISTLNKTNLSKYKNGMLSDNVTKAKNYFLGDGVSKQAKYTRFGVASAGVVGVGLGTGIGARFATGGNLTHNGKGEKGIIGIPFV